MIFDAPIERTFVLIALLSMAPLFVSLGVGVVVSVLQASTQIQEQSLPFLIKIIAVSATFYFLRDWYWAQSLEFMRDMLGALVFIGRMP